MPSPHLTAVKSCAGVGGGIGVAAGAVAGAGVGIGAEAGTVSARAGSVGVLATGLTAAGVCSTDGAGASAKVTAEVTEISSCFLLSNFPVTEHLPGWPHAA